MPPPASTYFLRRLACRLSRVPALYYRAGPTIPATTPSPTTLLAPAAPHTRTPTVSSTTACRRHIFSIAAAALGLKQTPSSTSSSSSSSLTSASTSTSATSTQLPDGNAIHTITTSRILPYDPADLFRIVADIDAYAKFLPHCTVSRVTHWRSPSSPSPSPATDDTASVPRWPARAELTVGWGPLTQSYSSRVYCVPSHGVVEAVSGRAGVPSLTDAERAELALPARHDQDRADIRAEDAEDDTFESLVTRWEVVSVPSDSSSSPSSPATRVELRIRFQFNNPFFQLAAGQVGSDMAVTMIEAFEQRAAALLGPPSQPAIAVAKR